MLVFIVPLGFKLTVLVLLIFVNFHINYINVYFEVSSLLTFYCSLYDYWKSRCHHHFLTLHYILISLFLFNPTREFGFLNYMIDVVDAPPAILSYLCRNYSIYRIPIAEKADFDRVPVQLPYFYIGEEKIYCWSCGCIELPWSVLSIVCLFYLP